jgi:hypothetical protein
MPCCGCIPICALKIIPIVGAIITICLGVGSIVVSILVKKIDENFLQCGDW